MCGGTGKDDFSVSGWGEHPLPDCGEATPSGDSTKPGNIQLHVVDQKGETYRPGDGFPQRSFLFPAFGMVGIRVASYNTDIPLQ
ncbi:MAG: hypothetical protein CMJ70_27860 [Planctomycetaceae bacterium]|nr:hypothetical protein [Planctomycetaceae bacterium]HAA70320.1 hypothetical protein [Planctomycetaceae bacterium]